MNSHTNPLLMQEVFPGTETMLNNVPVSIAYIDAEYCYISANLHYASRFGKKPHELVGRKLADIIGEKAFKNYSKPHLDLAFTGCIQHFKAWATHSHSDQCYLDICYTPIINADKHVLGVVASASDITDLKQQELLLSRYEQIVNTVNDALVFVGKDYKYKAVNDKFLETFGLSREDVVGKHSREIVGEDNFKRISKPNIESALSGKVAQSKSWSMQKNRGNRYMNFTYSPCFEDDGEVNGVIVTAQDITENFQARIDIDLYNAIVNTSVDFLAVIDRDFRYLVVNQRYADAFNFDKEELVGKHLKDVLGEDGFLTTSLPNFNLCIKHGKHHDSFWVTHPNGGRRYLEFEYFAHTDSTGNLQCVLFSGHDITELYQSRLIVEERERSLQKAQETAGLGMWEWNIETGYITVSPETCYVMSGGVYGQDWFASMDNARMLFHPDDAPMVQKVTENSLLTGEKYDIEHRIIWPDGSVKWIHVQATPEFVDGKCKSMVGTSMDVTKRREAQEETRRLNEELEARVQKRTGELKKSNATLKSSLQELKSTQDQLIQAEKMASLGSLVAGVAHEINTPVGMCVSTASFLGDRLQDWSSLYEKGEMNTEDFEDMLNTSKESMQIMMSNLVRSADLIRSFKQVSVDQSSEQMRTLFLQEYLEEVIQSLGPELNKNNHKITLECPQEVQFFTQPGAISQIMTNLIMNSLIHGFDVIDSGEITISVTSDQQSVFICYQDNGKGMSKEHSDKIFEPFFTTRRGSGGSGLGMHLTFNLVMQTLKGKISCESKEGEGVKFNIAFPLIQEVLAD